MNKSSLPGLSQRGRWLRPSPTFEVARLVKEVESTGKKVINFGIGTPPKLLELMTDSMRHQVEESWKGTLSQLGTYYPGSGLQSLRDAISQRFGNFVKEEVLVTGGGGKGGLHLALFATTDIGDKVVVPVPCWPTHFDLARDLGCTIVPLSTYGNNFYINPDELEALFLRENPKPKAIMYTSPNNPTGKNIDFETMMKIDEIAARHGAVVISDEAYRGQELVPAFDFTRYADRDAGPVKLRVVSFSKIISLAGERLGFIEAPSYLIAKMTDYQSNHSGNPPIAGMAYAHAILDHPDWPDFHKRALENLRKKQDAAWEILRAEGLDFVQPDGAFYIYLHLPEVKDSNIFAKELLIEQQVGLIPGVVFDPEEGGSGNQQKHEYFRMAIGVATMEEIVEGARRIRRQLMKR
ncbi:MAG: pyridoxal phosphate-dependent aminotransferase [bacterium]